MRGRVVISGMGCLSSAGADLENNRKNFAAGNCCLSEIKDPHVSPLKARFAGLLKEFEPARLRLPPQLASFDRHVIMAFIAAREALTAARVRPADFGLRLGLIFSTCSGPMLLIEKHYERIIRGEPRIGVAELFAKRYYSGATVLARALGIRGFTTTVVTACTAGTGAIALAADLIRCGMLDAALAGGSDAFAISTLAGFDGLKATSDGKCAPFSKPVGLNLGEAAAFVFLETYDSARQRGARIRGEIAGSGMSNDAYHCSAPEPTGRGLALAIQRALRDARLSPESISYINAHGTGTEANDKAETRAIRKVFGPRAEQVPVSSTKSMVGHCLGAAGVIETVASIACAELGVLPPTANFAGPREGCTLDYVPEPGRPWPQPRTFLTSNLAFGGHNATLAIKLPNDAGELEPDPIAADPAAADAGRRTADVPRGTGAPRSTSDDTICITSFGLVSCLGLGARPLLEAIRSGRSGLTQISLSGAGSLQAGMVDEEVVEKYDRRLDLRHMDRSSRWATVATQMAIRDAGVSQKPADLAELGLFLNLATGPSRAESEFLTSFLSHDHRVEQLVSFPYIVPSSVAGNVCRALRLTGHNLTLSCGPGAGLIGLVPAIAALRSGHAEALLCGAVDELTERILADASSAGLPARQGPPGEGAAVLMLETIRHAQARDARPLGFIRSCAFVGSTAPPDATDSSPLALHETIQQALTEAGIPSADITAIFVSNPDPRTIEALKSIFTAEMTLPLNSARYTGRMEASQPLLDLAAAMLASPAAAHGRTLIMLLVSSTESCAGAVIVENARVDAGA